MSAEFYAEDLGISLVLAKRIAWAMTVANGAEAVESRSVWAKHGKARVYFNLRSQNRFNAFRAYDRCYYDANDDELYVSGYSYGIHIKKKFSDAVKMDAGNFSGAKTREALRDFSRVFYEQKTNRD